MGNKHSTSKKRFGSKKQHEFLVEYSRFYQRQPEHVEQRRVVFISLLGLYQTWRLCPPYILLSALLVMPLEREWVYDPERHAEAIKTSLLEKVTLFQNDPQRLIDFIRLLRWKDSQGLVVWAFRGDGLDALSSKLRSLRNPVTGERYQGLPKPARSKQSFSDLSYKEVSTLLTTLNRDSLHPVTYYQEFQQREPQQDKKESPAGTAEAAFLSNLYDDMPEDVDHDNPEENWWISADYDPYDVEEGH